MPARRHLLLCSASLVLGWAHRAAWSAPSAPEPPAELQSVLPGAVWAGSARMRYLGLPIYDARLWVSPGFVPQAYWQTAFALELRYLRSLRGQAIAQRSLDEMRRGQGLDDALAAQWLAHMRAAFPDVQEGDRLTGVHTPDLGARFWANGQPRPEVADAQFSRRFFGIWLAETTSEPRLRKDLLARLPP